MEMSSERILIPAVRRQVPITLFRSLASQRGIARCWHRRQLLSRESPSALTSPTTGQAPCADFPIAHARSRTAGCAPADDRFACTGAEHAPETI